MEPVSQDITTLVTDDAALLPVAAPVVAHEVEAVTTPTASELGKLAESAGDNPLLALALAVLAVVGGGSAWKLWTKRSEQAHELAMKRLEMEAATMNGTAQPPPCQTKQAETDAKLAALEGRVAKAERTSLAMGDDFDPDDIQKRLVLLERAMKRIGVKPAAAGGSK